MNFEEILPESLTGEKRAKIKLQIERYVEKYPDRDLNKYLKNINSKIKKEEIKNNLINIINKDLISNDSGSVQSALDHLENGKYVNEYHKGNHLPFDRMLDYYYSNKSDRLTLQHADFMKADIESESIDLIITDPPYPRQFIHLYRELALFAERVLKPGGALFTMAGQSYLPEIFDLMKIEGLAYNWTLTYLTPGGQSPQLWQRRVNTFWKPVLWYQKGINARWIGDVVKSEVNDNDKRFHFWGQSISGMTDLINKVSHVGELILDPFMGGGATGAAALALDRRFMGIEIEDDIYKVAQQRLLELARSV